MVGILWAIAGFNKYLWMERSKGLQGKAWLQLGVCTEGKEKAVQDHVTHLIAKGCFQCCPQGFTWSIQISLPFPPCNHSYINNSKYFSDCSASFSSSCLFSASLLPKQQTELMWVVVGGRSRQQWSAHFLCFQCFSLAFPWVESKGWIIAGSIMMQREQTSLFKQWQLYEA